MSDEPEGAPAEPKPGDPTIGLHGLQDSPEIDAAVAATGPYAGISREGLAPAIPPIEGEPRMYECWNHGVVAGDHCEQCTVTCIMPKPAASPVAPIDVHGEQKTPSVPDIVCKHCGARYIRFIDGKWRAWTVDFYDPICYANQVTREHMPSPPPVPPIDAPWKEGGDGAPETQAPAVPPNHREYFEMSIKMLEAEIASLRAKLADAERKRIQAYNSGLASSLNIVDTVASRFDRDTETMGALNTIQESIRALAKESK